MANPALPTRRKRLEQSNLRTGLMARLPPTLTKSSRILQRRCDVLRPMPRLWISRIALLAATILGAASTFGASELPDIAAKVDGDPITSSEVIRLADTLI